MINAPPSLLKELAQNKGIAFQSIADLQADWKQGKQQLADLQKTKSTEKPLDAGKDAQGDGEMQEKASKLLAEQLLGLKSHNTELQLKIEMLEAESSENKVVQSEEGELGSATEKKDKIKQEAEDGGEGKRKNPPPPPPPPPPIPDPYEIIWKGARRMGHQGRDADIDVRDTKEECELVTPENICERIANLKRVPVKDKEKQTNKSGLEAMFEAMVCRRRAFE